MSHDFALWASDDPLENEEAHKIYLALAESGKCDAIKPSPKIAALLQDLVAKWPELNASNVDQSPWASPFATSDSHAIVAIAPSRVWDVWPFLGDLAK